MKFKKFLKVLTICHLVILEVSLVFPEIQPRIVGGSRTNIKEAPFLVRLLYNKEFFCGGTLIAPQFVVTAAHCLEHKQVENFTVVAGVTHNYQTGVRSNVEDVMYPEDYVKLVMDIAVLKLVIPLRGKNIQPTCLCNIDWMPGTDVQIYGWGVINEGSAHPSHQLRMATVQVVEVLTCLYTYRDYNILTNKMFCSSSTSRSNFCVGDSGGPAIIRGQFCGVISFNNGCNNFKFPGIYTNVLAVRGFIKSAVEALHASNTANFTHF